MQWENVEPALPDEEGGVPLEQVVELGSRKYVLNFERYLLREEDQQYSRPPRVMVPPDQWEKFCAELIKKGMFSWVHESELHTVQGKPILNGLFSVSKGEFHEGFETMRIIMNLVPINQVCRSMDGEMLGHCPHGLA